MALKHFNHLYDGGVPDIPLGVGDRYYAQDMARDFWFLFSAIGVNLKNMYKSFPILIKDTYIEKGTGWNQIDIPIAGGIVEYDVDVPNSFAAIPPTKTTETALIYVETTLETDYTMTAATLDGATPNYVKITYDETNGNSRLRAKKAGSYNYERVRSYTVTVDAVAPTDKDLVLAEVVGDNATFLTITRYLRTPLITSPYDYIVSTQDDFNMIIQRVAANQYEFIDALTSVKFNILAGGYLCTGATSFVELGDTWGYIETNNCNHIDFQPGAYLHTGILQSYFKIDTDDCVLENVKTSGTKGTPAAIVQSFILNANRVVFYNCKTTSRDSNVNYVGFQGSGTAEHNRTSKYIGCEVEDIDSSDKLYGFKDCMNLSNCFVTDILTTGDTVVGYSTCDSLNNCSVIEIDCAGGTGGAAGFDICDRLSNCYVEDLDSDDMAYGFSSCNQIVNSMAYDIAGSSGGAGKHAYGFYLCTKLSGCEAVQIDQTAGAGTNLAMGFSSCDQITSCIANDIDSVSGDVYGFTSCIDISASKSTHITSTASDAIGFNSCDDIGGCQAATIDGVTSSRGFSSCDRVSGCRAIDIDCSGGIAYGFNVCNNIVGCYVYDVDSSANNAKGFYDCENISGCYAYDIDSTAESAAGFEECDNISGCKAEKIDHSGGVGGKNAFGFNGCDQISACYATDIDTNGGGGVAYGYQNCRFGSSLNTDEPININNDYICTQDANITHQESSHPSNWT